MEIRIRRAAFSDLPAVKEMYAALVARMDREGWSVWDETYPRDFVGKDIEQGQLYLLLEGDRLAGAFALPAHDNGEGDVPWQEPSAPARYLYRFGVTVEYGGRGLGRLALERIGDVLLAHHLVQCFGADLIRQRAMHSVPPSGKF